MLDPGAREELDLPRGPFGGAGLARRARAIDERRACDADRMDGEAAGGVDDAQRRLRDDAGSGA